MNRSMDNIDLANLEHLHRELEMEYHQNRGQLTHLHQKLDEATLKNYKLQAALDRSNATCKELQLSLNVAQKKSHHFESKNRDMSETLLKLKLKQEMSASELETLQDYSQQMTVEQFDMARKVEDLEAKERFNVAFRNELFEKNTQRKKTFQELNEAVNKLRQEHEQVMAVKDMVLKQNDSKTTEKFFTEEILKLRTEKQKLEKELRQISAKCKKFEELMSAFPDLHSDNLVNNIIFKRWKSSREYYEKRDADNHEIIGNLTATIKTLDEEVNKLILKIEELTQLSTKDVIVIKDEVAN